MVTSTGWENEKEEGRGEGGWEEAQHSRSTVFACCARELRSNNSAGAARARARDAVIVKTRFSSGLPSRARKRPRHNSVASYRSGIRWQSVGRDTTRTHDRCARCMCACVRACVCVCICVCVYVCTPACKLNRAAALFLPVVVSDKTEREAAERRPSWQGRKRANVIPRGVLCWSKGRSVATLLQTWRTIGCSIAYPMHLRQIVSLPPPPCSRAPFIAL